MKLKLLKRILVLAAALCLCLSLSPAAMAASGKAADETPDYGNMSLEEIISSLTAEYNVDSANCYAGYLNLVTGEEYYHQGDEPVIAGSMYKVPLNMIYGEKMKSGELDWDAEFPTISYQYALDDTILNSSNEMAMFLWSALGSYADYRRMSAPYLGVDPDNVDESYFLDNNFSPKQIISCLKYLYDHSDTFTMLIEAMKKSEQERFFCYTPSQYEVAHKYGYARDDGNVHAYMNDCGIVYTDEPIALVMFTRDAPMPEDLLSGYRAAAEEYTQSKIDRAAAEAEAEAEKKAVAPIVAPAAVPSAEPVEAPSEESVAIAAYIGGVSLPVIPCGLIVLLMLAALVMMIALRKKHSLRLLWIIVAVLLCGCALLLTVVAYGSGTIYAKPSGDPQAVAADFVDAVETGDYPRAYGHLRDYSDLGLGVKPESAAGQLVYEALRHSYDFSLEGECRTQLLSAEQQVSLRYLDLGLIQADVKRETMAALEELVQSSPREQVYDSDDKYLPEAANAAYVTAVGKIMEKPEKYYTQVEFTLSLAYTGGSWKVVTNPTMLKALNGGAGY